MKLLRIIGPLVLLLGSLGACMPGPKSVPLAQDARGEVIARFASLAKAAMELDHERYFAHFDRQNFLILNTDGTTTDDFEEFRASYLASMEPIAAYQDLDFDRVSVSVLDADTAVLVNEFTAKLAIADGETVQARGGGLQVWQKRDGVWLLAAIGSSPAD